MADSISAIPQQPFLGRLAEFLRFLEKDRPEFLPSQLGVMQGISKLALPQASTIENLSYGNQPFTMPPSGTGAMIPQAKTGRKAEIADLVGMITGGVPGAGAVAGVGTKLSNEAADALVRAITRNPQATAPGVLQEAGQMGFAPAGVIQKAPNPFTVVHGTKQPFTEFQSGMGVTAKDIYTVPENFAQDASGYGQTLIKATASPKKMIDFSDFDKLDEPTVKAIKKAAKDSGITDKYYTFDQFKNDLMNGQMYQVGGGQSTQNAFLAELFTKFDAVKMPDARVGGGVSQSVVFQNPKLLQVKEIDNLPVEEWKKRKSLLD